MRIVYRITEQDYVNACDLFVANEPVYRRLSRRLMPWIGGILLLIQIVYIVSVPDANRAAVGFGSAISVYFLYCSFALRRYFRRRFRKDRRFQHDFTTDILEDGIHVVTPTAESQMKWENFVRFLESSDIFMLFHSDLIFNILPKRAFAAGEVDSFRELLRRKIPAKG
jgi:hypothetical protein